MTGNFKIKNTVTEMRNIRGLNWHVGSVARHLLLVVIALFLLTGCGEEGALSYTQQGMKAVEALAYEEALDLFANALEQEEDVRMLYRGMGLAYMGLTRYQEASVYMEAA